VTLNVLHGSSSVGNKFPLVWHPSHSHIKSPSVIWHLTMYPVGLPSLSWWHSNMTFSFSFTRWWVCVHTHYMVKFLWFDDAVSWKTCWYPLFETTLHFTTLYFLIRGSCRYLFVTHIYISQFSRSYSTWLLSMKVTGLHPFRCYFFKIF
jgi:hypothetical protein